MNGTLLNDIDFSNNGLPNENRYAATFTFVLNKFLEARSKDSKEIKIEETDLKNLRHKKLNVFDTVSLHGMLFSTSLNDMDNHRFLFYIKSCTGPSASALLNRFASDKHQTTRYIEKCVEFEDSVIPDSYIIAELSHLPDIRIGNVLQRPKTRKYEIAYLTYQSENQTEIIYLSDLVLQARRGVLYLRSKKLNKYVIPRLSTAHNFKKGNALYQFLGDFQYQNKDALLAWDWGLLESEVFLPRVTYKNIIITSVKIIKLV